MGLKKGVWIGIGVGAILIGPAIYGELSKRGETEELFKERRLAKDAGLPITVDALRPNPPIAEEENAAPLITKAHEILFPTGGKAPQRVLLDAKNYFQKSTPWDEVLADPAEAERQLSTLSEPLKLMGQASTRPKCDFRRPWEQGPAVLFPEFNSLRVLIRAFCVRGWLAAESGDPAAALQNLETAARICNLMRQEPTMISSLVEVGCEAITLEALRRIQAAHAKDSTYGPEMADRVFAGFGPPIDIKNSLRGEIYMCTGGLDYFSSEKAQEEFNRSVNRQTYFNYGKRPKVETIILRKYREMFAAWPKDPCDYLAIREVARKPSTEIETAMGELSGIFEGITSAPSGDSMIGHQALNAAAGLARRRLAGAFANCLSEWRKSGKYPSSLPQSGTDDLDPLTGKPLGYKLTKDGFLIYSVGIDLKDDGGKERKEGSREMEFDIVFRYP